MEMVKSNIISIFLGVLCFLIPVGFGLLEDDIYDRCQTKGTVCLGMVGEPGSDHTCYKTRNCDFVVALYSDSAKAGDKEGVIAVDIWGKPKLDKGQNKYIAMGISIDNAMGTDTVFACAAQGEKVSVLPTWNDVKSNKMISTNTPSIKTKESGLNDSGLHCSFTIPRKYENGPLSYDLTDPGSKYFMLISSGPFESGELRQHESRLASKEPSLTATSIIAMNDFEATTTTPKPRIPSQDSEHSSSTPILNSLMWITLLGVGTAIALN